MLLSKSEADQAQHDRTVRFCDWLHSEYMQPYRKPNAEERQWIDCGGEPPARVKAMYDWREKARRA